MLASPPQRVADLRLRSSDGPMRTRVWWPLSRDVGLPTGLLLFFVDAAVGEQDWLRELATEAQVVVVAAPCAQDPDAIVRARLRDGMAALEWAAEHAGQLEADPGRLFVGGIGVGATLADASASEAAACGWPQITRRLLIPLELPLDVAALARALTEAPYARRR